MKADMFYFSSAGRALLKIMQKSGLFRIAAWFLDTRASVPLIRRYVRKNGIEMSFFEGQRFGSFARFFSRKKDDISFETDPDVLISPCDSLMSVFEITDDLAVPMKGSVYAVDDLLPEEWSGYFRDGLCLVFRLEASDYHHFCSFDDCSVISSGYVPGQLHSVQPIALRSVPVYRLNRRWWSILDTLHFGRAAQIEIGAVLVGGVSFSETDGSFRKGEDMGSFEIAGSTVMILMGREIREKLVFCSQIREGLKNTDEVRVKMGSAIGRLVR